MNKQTKNCKILRTLGYVTLALPVILYFYCAIAINVSKSLQSAAAEHANAKVKTATGELCKGKVCEPAVLIAGVVDEDFTQAVQKLAETDFDRAEWVCLRSPGGDVAQAMSAAKLISDSHKKTCVVSVEKDGEIFPSTCASSCVFIFGAGQRRVLDENSKLAIHPSFFGPEPWCAPCNIAKSLFAVTQTKFNAWDNGLNENAVIFRLIEKSHAFKPDSVLNPTQTHNITMQEFRDWKVGETEDTGSGWHFIMK